MTNARWLWAIVSAAVALRLGAALYLGNDIALLPGTADQLSYHSLALRVLEGQGFSFGTGWWPATSPDQPTAHWSYLYVLFLSAVYGVVGPHAVAARIIQAIVAGVLQPLLTFVIARRLFGRRVALASAFIVAGYAYFVYYAGALMTESFFIVALLWSLDSAMRLGTVDSSCAKPQRLWRWLNLGLALAVATLLRQAILVCVPMILGWVAWRESARWRGGAPRVRRAALASLARGLGATLLIMALCILPWTIRNYRAFHEFVLLNTNAGFAFYWGNHPIHGNTFIPILPGDGSRYGTLVPDDLRSLNEAQMDRALLGRGLQLVADEPWRYVRLSISRGREYLKFWPSSDSGTLSNVARVASFGLCAPFMLVGLYLGVRKSVPGGSPREQTRRAYMRLVLSVALVYSLVHVLTWTLVRYRLPIDALLLPFAAVPMVCLVDRFARRPRSSRESVFAAGRPSSTGPEPSAGLSS